MFIFLLAVELRKIEGLLTGVRSGNRNSISRNMCGKLTVPRGFWRGILQMSARFRSIPQDNKKSTRRLQLTRCWLLQYLSGVMYNIRGDNRALFAYFIGSYKMSDRDRFNPFTSFRRNYMWILHGRRLSARTLTVIHANNALNSNGAAEDSTQFLD